MSAARLTPAQTDLLMRVGRAIYGAPFRRVVARSRRTVAYPPGVLSVREVGGAVTLERLADKGYLEYEALANGAGVRQRYYRLTDQGAAWWAKRYNTIYRNRRTP